jgi:hypothetical protein
MPRNLTVPDPPADTEEPDVVTVELLAGLMHQIGDALVRWAERAAPAPDSDPAALAPVIRLLDDRQAAA